MIKPLAVALKGKGLSTLVKRTRSIGNRYGLTRAKMDHALAHLSEIVRRFDCRATLPITAVALARSSVLVQNYQSQGIEFAIHGYLHVDYSQLPPDGQAAHLRKASQIFRGHGIHYTGFRSPYLRWNEHTLAALGQNGVSYDSSPSLAWDVGEKYVTDSYMRALDFYGAQPAAGYLALPYLDHASGLLRIPYCLPDDEALLERLIWNSSAEMEQVWPAMFHNIHEQGGLFALGLHPERIRECTNALVATLEEARRMGSVWHARLGEISTWWRTRTDTVVEVVDIQEDVLELRVAGPPGTTLLLRSLDAETATQPWLDGYRRASQMPCIVRSGKRPFIGIAPRAASAMTSFLKQQGYILEVSLDPDRYSLYLDLNSFSREDEQHLINQIEGKACPLVRLGRWPEGARSALCITGDIDALTLWDYGLRLFGK